MRRIVYAVGGTAAGLAALLTLKAHTGASAVATTNGPAAGATATGGAAASGTGTANGSGGTSGATGAASGAAGTTGGPGGTGNAAGNAAPGSSAVPGGAPGTQQISGNVASTAYGPVQVQLTVTNHKIVKVTILQQPTATAHDLQIGQFAFPQLESETFAAQSAKINAISGASYTSAGYIQSLQSAIDRGA